MSIFVIRGMNEYFQSSNSFFPSQSFYRCWTKMNSRKVIKCRAAVVWAPNEKFTIEEIEVAPPKAHEVRIKLVASGVCHTDLNAQIGEDPMVNFPVILGHEGAGIVESVGEGVTGFNEGDHVIPLYTSQCRECKFCKSDKTNICSKILPTRNKGLMPDGTSRFTCIGKPIYHYMGTSTFSEYTVVADISLCKIDEKAPLEKVCLLGCGIPTGYGAALNTAKVEKGSTCAVWGLGAGGLTAVMGCKAAGASKIIGVDINPDKFKIGKIFGGTDFVNPKDYDRPINEVLAEMTDEGLDYTFECIGNIATMQAALDSCHPGWGMAVLIGMAPLGKNISTNPLELIGGKHWTGSSFGGWNSVDSVPKLVENHMNKEGILVDEFITHNMTLDKINDAFDLLKEGKSIRTVINLS